MLGGIKNEFVFCGRLDNLCMSYCSLQALLDSTSEEDLAEETGVRAMALFDHEEVGSDSAQVREDMKGDRGSSELRKAVGARAREDCLLFHPLFGIVCLLG